MEDYYYRCYYNILQRCYNQNNTRYYDYGGRGISCYWNDFESFKQYIIETIGEKPDDKTLDRYPDNDGNYEPGNLRWATPAQQRVNQRALKQRSRVRTDNATGYQYVHRTRSGTYDAVIKMNGKSYRTARYKEPVQAYLKALSLRSFLYQ